MKPMAPLVALFLLVSIPTTTVAKEKDKGNFIPCQKVFVTGNQPYSVGPLGKFYAYLYDAKTHELLWKYQGSWPWDNELMFDSACAKKRRAGTWGTSGGVPNGLSCDEKKLPTDLSSSGAAL